MSLRSKGISLVELIVTMCAIALLSAIVIPAISGVEQMAKDAASAGSMSSTETTVILNSTLNHADALLISGSNSLPNNATVEGYIPQAIRDHLIQPVAALDTDSVLEAASRQALIDGGVSFLRFRDDNDLTIDEKERWTDVHPLEEVNLPLAQLDVTNVEVQRLLEERFDQVRVFDAAGIPIQNKIVVVGVGAQSDIVQVAGQKLPIDSNAPAGAYNRFYALLWVAGPQIEVDGSVVLEADGVTPVIEAKPKAQFLGLIDSQFRSTQDVAQDVLDAKK
jgi:hypothetical protein